MFQVWSKVKVIASDLVGDSNTKYYGNAKLAIISYSTGTFRRVGSSGFSRKRLTLRMRKSEFKFHNSQEARFEIYTPDEEFLITRWGAVVQAYRNTVIVELEPVNLY